MFRCRLFVSSIQIKKAVGVVIQRLQNELPEFFILGDYDPGKQICPAIWLKCVLAGNALFEKKTCFK